MPDPLVTIITRTAGKRPALLQRADDSIYAQENNRWQQVLYWLLQGEGYEYANGAISQIPECLTHGRYVYVLDDDDELRDVFFVDALEDLDEPWVMVKCWLGSEAERPSGIWPVPWGEDWRPVFGNVSGLNLVVRTDIFHEFKSAWTGGCGGDYRMAKAMWDSGLRPYWLDRLVACTQWSERLG